MNASSITVVVAVFAACAVEMVEALTIVVAAGVTEGWRSAVEGATAALFVLLVLIAAVGVPLVHFVPLDVLRVVVGTLLLVMGEAWLRKAILRGSGHKRPHDEDQIFEETCTALRSEGPPSAGRSTVGFVVAFKGVFLEGIEVAIIVVSVGGSQHRLGLAAAGAGAAVVVVGGLGMALARQLREVPENLIKWGVGIMLTSLGLFWMGEGVGIHWPGNDLAIPVLVGVFFVVSAAMAKALALIAPAPMPAPIQRRP